MKQLQKINNLALSFILSQFALTSASADATLNFTNSNQSDNVIYIKDGKVRFSDSGGQSNEYSIFDSNKNKLIHISPKEKSYIVINPDTMNQQMDAVKQQMDLMMAQMKEQMKNMPPEQRQMMQKMMSHKMKGQIPGMGMALQPPKKEQIKTGNMESVAGVKCEIIKIQINQIMTEELCIANENQFAINSGDKKTIQQMIQFFKKLSQKTSSIMGDNSMPGQFDGVPIRTREYDNAGKLISESTLHSISNKKVNNDIVSIPENYTKHTMY